MIKALIIEPNLSPEIIHLDTDLNNLQELVCGNIQEVYPFDDNVCLICNENGKDIGLEENRCINELGYSIYGTFLIVGDNNEEDYVSLTEEQIEKYKELYLKENHDGY